jgi:hypothetical protein
MRSPKGGGLWWANRLADPVEYRGGQFLPAGGHFWSWDDLDALANEYRILERLGRLTVGRRPSRRTMIRLRTRATYETWESEQDPRRRAMLWDDYQGRLQLALAPEK